MKYISRKAGKLCKCLLVFTSVFLEYECALAVRCTSAHILQLVIERPVVVWCTYSNEYSLVPSLVYSEYSTCSLCIVF